MFVCLRVVFSAVSFSKRVNVLMFYVDTNRTRKLCYRKDDRAMRAI